MTDIVETNHHSPTPELVTLGELGDRWGITDQGAKHRLTTKGIEIVRDEQGRRAARKVDVDGVDFTPLSPKEHGGIRKSKMVGFPPPSPIVDQTAVARPIAHFEADPVGDSERVKRLLKALSAIREILTEQNGAPGFAAWAVADYALAAETTDGS